MLVGQGACGYPACVILGLVCRAKVMKRNRMAEIDQRL